MNIEFKTETDKEGNMMVKARVAFEARVILDRQLMALPDRDEIIEFTKEKMARAIERETGAKQTERAIEIFHEMAALAASTKRLSDAERWRAKNLYDEYMTLTSRS